VVITFLTAKGIESERDSQITRRRNGKEVKLVQVGLEEHVVDLLVSENMGSHRPGDPARDWTRVFEAGRGGETVGSCGDCWEGSRRTLRGQ
jgi:hypothetical protein